MKRRNRGWFCRGTDPRRHQLTLEERQRGGWTRWLQIMAELRTAMNLPLPLADLWQYAEVYMAAKQKLAGMRP